MNLRKGLWTSKHIETVIDYGKFEVGLNAVCIMIWLLAHRWQVAKYGGLNKNHP